MEINGTKQLIDSLFKGYEETFIEHFIKTIRKFPSEKERMVLNQKNYTPLIEKL